MEQKKNKRITVNAKGEKITFESMDSELLKVEKYYEDLQYEYAKCHLN